MIPSEKGAENENTVNFDSHNFLKFKSSACSNRKLRIYV